MFVCFLLRYFLEKIDLKLVSVFFEIFIKTFHLSYFGVAN